MLREGSEKADVILLVQFDTFSVTDHGATIKQKIDGEEKIIQDAWTRVISGNYSFQIIRTSDDAILGKKDYKIFDGDSDEVPKASLREPVEVCKKQVESSAYWAAIMVLDTPYQEAISLEDSKTKDKALKEKMKAALKLAKNKDYEGAKAAYKEIYDATNDPAAGFNYARMLQVTNVFDEAEEVLKAVSTGDKDKTVKKALENLAKDRDNYTKIHSR